MKPSVPVERLARGVRLAALAALALCAFAAARATAQATALPMLSPCAQASPPSLPARWRAVGLLFPFQRQQLDVGEFIYDGALPALRATLYGVESGAVDLLITDKETYQLSGPPDAPNSCTALGPKYRPPATQWLTSAAVCDGEAPVANKNVQWWKMPADDGRIKWQWYRADTRLPWRMMLPSRASDPAVIGDYGMSYFPTFTPLVDTKLKGLRDLCVAKAQKASAAAAAAATARDLMALGADIAETERAKRLHALIPGLNRKACTGDKPPSWPRQFVMTGILTPVQFKWTPLPGMLYYDWDNAATLFALLYTARSAPPALEIVSVLQKGVGYSVERLPNGTFACGAKGPGVLRPDWMAVAGCECKAAIDHNPDLGPDEVSYIRACPVKNQGLHVNWSWYAADARPILFTEPGATGGGLNIADYHRWLPGQAMPREAFEVPQLCTRAEEAGLPPVGNGMAPAAAESCSDCHVTRR